ncbi:GntR family transcriptional regulator [Effusibacillus dendaii]|uniref:GntR family transcriptional regulator n=1 Tax=Effusibacillus dendaii TaxID=2743772 RepID=A0A7I8D657_9BACL|nr:GntR family transcriptional regulator [Effusibacillus dendaii]BCJ85638.1 GntR family transcriptional regulator [Effusibacillus dendaii]
MKAANKENPLYELIYNSLRTSIFSGELRPGERLIDSRIAEEMGVSRSPVREAFRKLEHDELLKNKDGLIFVYEPSLQDVIDLYQVRVGLEAVAAYLATQYMPDAELEKLQNSIYEAEHAIKNNKINEVVDLNTFFHEFVVMWSKNSQLQKMMSNIRSRVLLYRNTLFKQYNRGDDFVPEHQAVVDAIRERNPKMAAKKMSEHTMNDMNIFKKLYVAEFRY